VIRKTIGQRTSAFLPPLHYLNCHHIVIWFLIYEHIRGSRCSAAPCPGYVPDQASMIAAQSNKTTTTTMMRILASRSPLRARETAKQFEFPLPRFAFVLLRGRLHTRSSSHSELANRRMTSACHKRENKPVQGSLVRYISSFS